MIWLLGIIWLLGALVTFNIAAHDGAHPAYVLTVSIWWPLLPLLAIIGLMSSRS